MLPDVGAGTPMTALWFIAAIFLLGLTLIAGIGLALFNRALQKRDTADSGRDNRLNILTEMIRKEELARMKMDASHQRALNELQLDLLKCQRDFCSHSVAKEEYMGDFLRFQTEMKESLGRLETKMEEFITRMHARVDAVLGSGEAAT
jgi:hypothetical protein